MPEQIRENRLVVVSNRLPVIVTPQEDRLARHS